MIGTQTSFETTFSLTGWNHCQKKPGNNSDIDDKSNPDLVLVHMLSDCL